MNLGELFANLSYRELNDLALGHEGAGTIREEDQEKLRSMVQSALTEIYSKKTVKVGYVRIQVQENIRTYALDPRHRVSDTDPANTAARYILDSLAEPFTGDVIKIKSVAREDDPSTDAFEGAGVRVNHLSRASQIGIQPDAANSLDPLAPPSIRMVEFDTFRIEAPVPGEILRVEYQADHPRLSVPVDLKDRIKIPPQLQEALQVRVASAAYAASNNELHVARSQGLLNYYRTLMQEADLEGLVIEDMVHEGRDFDTQGFR